MSNESGNPDAAGRNQPLTAGAQDHLAQTEQTTASVSPDLAGRQTPNAQPTTTASADQNPPQERNQKVPLAFVLNLVLLIVVGTSFCIWLLHYTDKFDDFAQVLALGGGLTWLAFVLKLLSEERLKALQSDLDKLIFSQWWLTVLLLLASATGLYYRAHYGTLQVELFRGNEERILTVKGAGLQDDPWRLMPGQKVRIPVWTSAGAPTPLYVKVSGYPDLRVRIAPHERRELRIPEAFTRRVILLKPTSKLLVHRTEGFSIRVKVNGHALQDGAGRPLKDSAFDGYPLWIGADEDVIVPQATLDRWRDSLSEDVRSIAMGYLQHPEAITKTGFDLSSGDHVCVEMLRKDGSPYLWKEIIVRPVEPNHDFAQEEEIDVRNDANGEGPASC
jgi:hypothetical protein